MFTLDLKLLLHLCAEQKDGRIVAQKRIRCKKRSYIILFGVKDGILTIKQAKRIRNPSLLGNSKRKIKRSQRIKYNPCSGRIPNEVENIGDTGTPTEPNLMTVGCQTEQQIQSHASNDTTDLILKLSRHVQTNILMYSSSSTQTVRKMLDSSTQIVVTSKSRLVQADETKLHPRLQVGTQTKRLETKDNWVQAKISDDVNELLKPYESTLVTLLNAICMQGDMLLKATDCLESLVNRKKLRQWKRRVQKNHNMLNLAKLPKIKQRDVQGKNRKRIKRTTMAMPGGVGQTQTETTPTVCQFAQTEKFEKLKKKFTQTDELKEEVAKSMVATATQTNKLRGSSWLSRGINRLT